MTSELFLEWAKLLGTLFICWYGVKLFFDRLEAVLETRHLGRIKDQSDRHAESVAGKLLRLSRRADKRRAGAVSERETIRALILEIDLKDRPTIRVGMTDTVANRHLTAAYTEDQSASAPDHRTAAIMSAAASDKTVALSVQMKGNDQGDILSVAVLDEPTDGRPIGTVDQPSGAARQPESAQADCDNCGF